MGSPDTNIDTRTELEETITTLSADPRVKCIVFTGHGRLFCAGADLSSSFKGGEEKPR